MYDRPLLYFRLARMMLHFSAYFIRDCRICHVLRDALTHEGSGLVLRGNLPITHETLSRILFFIHLSKMYCSPTPKEPKLALCVLIVGVFAVIMGLALVQMNNAYKLDLRLTNTCLCCIMINNRAENKAKPSKDGDAKLQGLFRKRWSPAATWSINCPMLLRGAIFLYNLNL